jgi:WD40 repeat protein
MTLFNRRAFLVLAVGLFFLTTGEIVPPVNPIQLPVWDLITAIAWAPDGEYIAVGSGNRILIFPAGKDSPIFTLQVGVFTTSLSFSPDSKWLAAGNRDGKIRIWGLADQAEQNPEKGPLKVIKAHRKGVNSVQFNPTGELLASGGNDAVARIWNWKTERLVNEVIGGTYAVPSITFISESELAIANGNIIRLRDANSGRFTGTFRSKQPFFRLAVSPDRRWLATGNIENGVQIWELSEAHRSGVQNYPSPVLDVTHTGKTRTIHSLIWDVQFSPNGRIIASAGGDGMISIWDLEMAEKIQSFSGHRAAVTCLAFSPDGSWLVSGGLDAQIRYWPMDVK